jgi:hypothetical protein
MTGIKKKEEKNIEREREREREKERKKERKKKRKKERFQKGLFSLQPPLTSRHFQDLSSCKIL